MSRPLNLETLITITPSDLQILEKINELGAALEEELAVKLNRPGDNLKPELENLKRRKLLKVRTIDLGGDTSDVYMIHGDVRGLFF